MLKVWFAQQPENLNRAAKCYFDHQWDNEWFYDPLVVEIIKDVDKTKVVAPTLMIGPIGPIPPERLSGGVKTLIFMLKVDKYIWNATNCGDNCAKWIVEISKRKDLTIFVEHFMNYPEDIEIDGILLNNGRHFHSAYEYDMSILGLIDGR